jgi:hypothetical protein
VINGIGAVVTAIVLVIVAITKALKRLDHHSAHSLSGRGLSRHRRHYDRVAAQLNVQGWLLHHAGTTRCCMDRRECIEPWSKLLQRPQHVGRLQAVCERGSRARRRR